MTDSVRDQYEAYPYPSRNPAEEARRLVVGSPSNLLEVNHYLFGGRRDFTRPFRALVAGGGTGDATIMLAQQLADAAGSGGTAGEVVYLDLSAASREIAEARAAARKLTNIRFVTGSLLDLAGLDLGTFDYIDCCGVLHHLAEPEAGLAALTEALAPDGGMGLMVYGTYGRSGVYALQDVLRTLVGDRPLAEQVSYARRLLNNLPATNLFARNPVLRDHSDVSTSDADDRRHGIIGLSQKVAACGPNAVTKRRDFGTWRVKCRHRQRRWRVQRTRSSGSSGRGGTAMRWRPVPGSTARRWAGSVWRCSAHRPRPKRPPRRS